MSIFQRNAALQLTDLIPFVSQLNDIFLNWTTLDDSNRNHVKFIVEQNKNMELKLILEALEQWDNLQNYGAPGVEMDSVVCDNNTLHRIVDSSAILNEIIQEVVYTKNTDDK